MKQLLRLLLVLLMLTPLPVRAAGEAGMGEIPWPERGIWPESPRARAFREVAMPSPALATGACEFSVPLYTVEVEGFSLPISLQYRSNGIRVEDDPCPVGFGWVFSPALRVTRQIMGRPDEHFQFAGENFKVEPGKEYEYAFRCVTTLNADFIKDSGNKERYDSEHDIFTVHLADKSFTMILWEGKFIGAGWGEYRVANDEKLTYIEVTDPQGRIYRFATEGQKANSDLFRTEWLLTSVTLPSGREIRFGWTPDDRRREIVQNYGAKVIRYHWNNYFVENEPQTSYSGSYQFYGRKNLTSISFPGGTVSLSYQDAMLARMIVASGSSAVFTASLVHDASDPTGGCLLKGVTTSDEGTYTFTYNDTRFSDEGSIDWWGYYNGRKNGHVYHPAVQLKSGRYPSARTVLGADRSIDAECMKANMLTKAVFPTGGSAEWEYEAHRFAESVADPGIQSFIDEPQLSAGGGLRVKRITLRSGPDDGNPRIRTYTYGTGGDGLARVEALPLLRTFIADTRLVELRSSAQIYPDDGCLTICGRSNYAMALAGMTEIWYPQVTETCAEGKTEYFFDCLCRNRSQHPYGYAYVSEMSAVFSKGPVQTAKKTYRSDGTAYALVESETNNYSLATAAGKSRYSNFCFPRRRVQLDWPETAPDCGEDGFYLTFFGDTQGGEAPREEIIRPEDYTDWFSHQIYYTTLQTEQLTSTVTVTHTDNGTITDTVEYQYIAGTGLTSSVTHTRGDDRLEMAYEYALNSARPVGKTMLTHNLTGVVLGVTRSFNGFSQGYSLGYGLIAGNVFRPLSITLSRGTSSWTPATYDYDRYGNLIERTDNAGVWQTWTWDSDGLYPVQTSVRGLLRTSARWQPLVGVTELTTPAGVRENFTYDAARRLTAVALNGKPVELYAYRVSQDTGNSVTTTALTSYTNGLRTVERYDGLGRPTAKETCYDSGTVIDKTEYDSMGRPAKKRVAAPYGDDDQDWKYEVSYYEPSPRSLPVSTMKAGTEWHSSKIMSRIVRKTNPENGSESCLRFTATADGVSGDGCYPAGFLSIERVVDEDGVWVETAKDIRGLTVRRSDTNGHTHYVYDGYGDLRYILPPGLSSSATRDDEAMQNYAYWYDYDSRGRCILSRIPGTKESRRLYDPADRLAAEQTADHADGVWRLYGYDAYGRLAVAYDAAISDATAAAFASECRTVGTGGTGKDGYAFDHSFNASLTPVWATYYDSYWFITRLGLLDAFNFKAAGNGFDSSANASPLGLVTGTYTGLGYEANYYDACGREIQRYATGYNKGRRSTAYTYDGQPALVRCDYDGFKVPPSMAIMGGSETSLRDRTERFVYDGCGRLTRYSIAEDGADSAFITTRYDSRGFVGTTGHGAAVVRDYQYDIHGWPLLTATRAGSSGMTDRLFYADGAFPRFNGNISSRDWSGGRYDYVYDSANRFVKAKHSQSNGNVSRSVFSEELNYDNHSNLTYISRYGVTDRKPDGSETLGQCDDYGLQYRGHRVTKIQKPVFQGNINYGNGDIVIGTMPMDFEIEHDQSGRIVSDQSRGITKITYNNDGMPLTITFSDGHSQRNSYDGLGRLAATVYTTSTSSVVGGLAIGLSTQTGTTTYVGDGQVLFTDGKTSPAAAATLRRSCFPGGYVDARGKAMYCLADYRGNVTDVVDAAGNVVQHTDYYPSGLPWRPVEGDNRRLFEGKEYLTADGLDEYDYAARRYAPRFLMMNRPDPHAENTPWLSPYTPFAANPILHIDPSGMDCFTYDEKGHLLSQIEDTEKDVVQVQNADEEILSSLEFEYGTVEKIHHNQISLEGTKIDIDGLIDVDGLVIRGDDNGTAVFEMFASIPGSDIEYSHLKMGYEGTGPNLITTSHLTAKDVSMSFYLNKQYQFGYTIREYIHSHPSTNTIAGDEDLKFVQAYRASTKQNFVAKIWTKSSGYTIYDP